MRTAPNDPQENIQVKQSLLAAIRNSAEGKVLSISDMRLGGELLTEVS